MIAACSIERPIIFTGPSLPAIYAGKKKQTRRLRGLEAINKRGAVEWLVATKGGTAHFWHRGNQAPIRIRCPFGVPGDRLWIRERWALQRVSKRSRQAAVEYLDGRPEARVLPVPRGVPMPTMRARRRQGDWPPRSPLFMPRWAARGLVELVRVRVERLQELSEEDARAEGAQPEFEADLATMLDRSRRLVTTYVLGFKHRWDAMHGPESWKSNPFVWVLTFRRIRQAREAA